MKSLGSCPPVQPEPEEGGTRGKTTRGLDGAAMTQTCPSRSRPALLLRGGPRDFGVC